MRVITKRTMQLPCGFLWVRVRRTGPIQSPLEQALGGVGAADRIDAGGRQQLHVVIPHE